MNPSFPASCRRGRKTAVGFSAHLCVRSSGLHAEPHNSPLAPANCSVAPAHAACRFGSVLSFSSTADSFSRFRASLPAETELFPAQPPACPSEIAIAPAESPMAPAEPPAYPAESRMVPAEPRVFPCKPQAFPAEPPACPAESRMVPAELRMVPAETEAILPLPEDAPAQRFTSGTYQPSRKKAQNHYLCWNTPASSCPARISGSAVQPQRRDARRENLALCLLRVHRAFAVFPPSGFGCSSALPCPSPIGWKRVAEGRVRVRIQQPVSSTPTFRIPQSEFESANNH